MTSNSETPNSEHRIFSVFPQVASTAPSIEQPDFASRFLPRLVHETRSPTHAIAYFLEAFTESLDQTRLDKEAQENLEMIRNSAEELRILLRSLSRLAHCQDEKRVSQLQLGQAVKNAWTEVESNYQATAKLSAECADLSMHADNLAMDICFQCIFDNCFKFRHAERPLEVCVLSHQDSASLTLEIVDNGIGIEGKYIDKCYQYFERLHSRSQYPGGGLGIPTAIECIKHVGGKLTLDSDGATFTKVTLSFPGTLSN